MGVYINMEMPMNCGECLLAKLSPTGESLICNYMLSRVSWDERPFDCPLVPVPPHGRLIDANVLMENEENISFKDEWHMTVTEAFVSVKNIAHAPTIIPAEEGE